MDDGSAGTSVDPRDVHDFWPRLLVSPILGALVVNLSGLIDHSQHSTAGLIASYVWFAAVLNAARARRRRVLKAAGVLSISEHMPDPDFTPFDALRRRVEANGFGLAAHTGSRWAYTANFRVR